jgi:hypothetical protein
MSTFLWISLIVLIVVFIFLFLYLLKKNKKKSAFILFVPFALLICAVLIGCIFSGYEKAIWVNGADESSSFQIDIKNKKILATGSTYEFILKDNEENFRKKILEKYPNASMDGDTISIFDKNQVYRIKKLNDNKFKLSAEFIVYSDNDTVYHIPFPEDILEDDIRVSKTFKIKKDFSYLKEYYSDFSNVTTGENTITLKLDKIIVLEIVDNSITIVDKLL